MGSSQRARPAHGRIAPQPQRVADARAAWRHRWHWHRRCSQLFPGRVLRCACIWAWPGCWRSRLLCSSPSTNLPGLFTRRPHTRKCNPWRTCRAFCRGASWHPDHNNAASFLGAAGSLVYAHTARACKPATISAKRTPAKPKETRAGQHIRHMAGARPHLGFGMCHTHRRFFNPPAAPRRERGIDRHACHSRSTRFGSTANNQLARLWTHTLGRIGHHRVLRVLQRRAWRACTAGRAIRSRGIPHRRALSRILWRVQFTCVGWCCRNCAGTDGHPTRSCLTNRRIHRNHYCAGLPVCRRTGLANGHQQRSSRNDFQACANSRIQQPLLTGTGIVHAANAIAPDRAGLLVSRRPAAAPYCPAKRHARGTRTQPRSVRSSIAHRHQCPAVRHGRSRHTCTPLS